jgi:hypothetical protein
MSKPKYTCNDYREEMILLGLRKQLNDTTISPEKKKEIEKEIRTLEQKMGMD